MGDSDGSMIRCWTDERRRGSKRPPFTFSHLADAFIQSDIHMCDLQCIHILHLTFTLMAHCPSGAIRGSVSCSRTLRQRIKLATFCLLNDFFTSCTTVAPNIRIISPIPVRCLHPRVFPKRQCGSSCSHTHAGFLWVMSGV